MYSVLQKFIRQPGMPVDSAIRVYRRYLKLEPTHAEEYIAYLKVKVSAAQGSTWGRWGGACEAHVSGAHGRTLGLERMRHGCT